MQDKNKKQLLKLAEKSSVIAFDCFDTLVHRKCNNEQVLVEWAKYMERILCLKVSWKDLYKTRKEKEIYLKKEIEEPSYKDLLKEVYDSCHMKISFDEFYNMSKKMEVAIEQKALVIDEDGLLLIHDLKEMKKEIIVISDFYFGKELLKPILDNLGIGKFIDEIFVSSDIGKRKSTGNLYQYVLKRKHIRPEKMLMIGDNSRSDVEIPSKLGIRSWHKKNEWNSPKILEKKDIIKNIYEISGCNYNPLRGYIPILLLFADRLYKYLTEAQEDKIYFCSREGQGLKKIFDYYQSFYPKVLQFETNYLYVSRKATVLAGLENIQRESFDNIFSKSRSYSLKSFMEFMEFSQELNEYIKDTYKVNDETIIINNKERVPIFNKIINDKRFILEYDRIRKNKKELLDEYLLQQGINIKQGKLCMVDIGWKGSIQDNLRKVINDNVIIHGYYLGIFDKGEMIEKCSYSTNNTKTGVIFSTISKKNKDCFIFRKNRMFLETLFTADHGPVMGYKKVSGKINPVIKNDEMELQVFYKINKYLQDLDDGYRKLVQKIWNSETAVDEIDKELKKCYLKRNIVDRPQNIAFYNDISKHVVENYISGLNEKFSNKFSLEFIMKKLHDKKMYYFDYNMHFLDIIYEKNIKLLFPIGYLISSVIYEYMNIRYN